MKTSFYFFIWILIYPLLALLCHGLVNAHSSILANFIANHTFLVALAIVWGLSYILNRSMSNTLLYERVTGSAPVLEDVYTGNVASFKKRLATDAIIETGWATYLTITTVFVAIATFKFGANDWVALVIFGFFAIRNIPLSFSLIKAKQQLSDNPTPEQCVEIATDTYRLPYESYYNEHQGVSYDEMLPPKPKYYIAFLIFSLIIAAITALLGTVFIIDSIIGLIVMNSSAITSTYFSMNFLYGSFAIYFGVKDLISCIKSLRK